MKVSESKLKKANRLYTEGRYLEALGLYKEIQDKDENLAYLLNFNIALCKKRKPGDKGHLGFVKEKNTPKEESNKIKIDRDFYLEQNPDVKAAGVDPEHHYWSNGEKEKRWPTPYFDPDFYLKVNSDVRVAGISPFVHYRDSGAKEGRLGCSPLTDSERKVSTYTKPLLFVGHDGILAGSEIVLLEIIRWFYENTQRRIKLLLLAPGPVANRYANYCDLYVLPKNQVDNAEQLAAFLNERFEFAYLNTVVSGNLFHYLEKHKISLNAPVITHIHEMEKVLDTFPSAMQRLLEKTQHWISASPASTETLIGKYLISPDVLTTVPAFINPVARKGATANELQAKARKELGLKPDSFVIAGCGTIYWRKGTDLFIETAKKLKAKTDKAIEFVWLGAGPDRKELEAELTKDEKKWIKFAGNRNNANELLAAADVFYMSSREDPFPLVVLESAQHGIPTVCFGPATGITAFIEQDAGIAVSEINTDLAAEAFLTLLEQPKLRAELGNKAREKLFGNYTTDQQNLKIFRTIQEATGYKPSVSVIVPFYNHEKFIEERLDSILAQSIKDIEIIALDDCSTDDTVAKVRPYQQDSRVTLIENETNSGSPFKQWEKGIRLAQGDVIWIAEGDDSCSPNFLNTLLPYFNDPLVNISYAKTLTIDENGKVKSKQVLDDYLERAYPGKFDKNYILDGFIEVQQQLASVNNIVNASGILIRKDSLGSSLEAALEYKITGDRRIYLECLKSGKIAYDVSATNYFRRHSSSQVSKLDGSLVYFKEKEEVARYIANNYALPSRSWRRLKSALIFDFERFSHLHPGKQISDLVDLSFIEKLCVDSNKTIKNIAFYVHGMMFSKGGIERMVHYLANHLAEKGNKVTIYCRKSNSSKSVYPLYESVRVLPIFDEKNLDSSVKNLRKKIIHDEIDLFIPMLSEWLFEPVVEAAQNTGAIILASERNDPWKIMELWWDKEKRIKCFEKVDYIHVLLNVFKDSLPDHLKGKVIVIPNGVELSNNNTSKKKEEKIILSVGRLAPQKRFDRLIEAANLLKDKLRNERYKVTIYGEGSERKKLQAMIEQFQISDIVELRGVIDNIEDVYCCSTVFAFPSEFEGFGNVIIEALSYALPVVAFKDCNGPNEIVRDGVEGYLCHDVEEFSNKIAEVIDSKSTVINKNASKRALDYSIDKYIQHWASVISGIFKGDSNV